MPSGRRLRKRGPGAATYPRRTKSFVQPCLLLLLREGEAHGYALIDRLKRVGLADDRLNPSLVYRGLREMEQWGWVTSRWDTEGAGPSRRLYRITPEGEEFLRGWAGEVNEMRSTLDRFIEVYGDGDLSSGE